MASSRGFTLIEVLVALTIGALVVLAAHQSFGIAMEASARLAAAREVHDAEMRGRTFLTVALGSLDVTGPQATGFRGEPERVAFTALPARRLTFLLADGWLVASEQGGNPERLLPAERVAFDYLLQTGANEAWVREWQSPVSAPLAVRVRLLHPSAAAADTLLFAIGSRG